MGPRQRDDGTVRLGARSFALVIAFGLACGAGAFVWTIDRHAVSGPTSELRGRSGWRQSDPNPAWGSTARMLYVQGRFDELAASAMARRRDWGQDPEAWLFGAFALEAMAERSGLEALSERAMAQGVWQELLDRFEPPDRDGDGEPDRAPQLGWRSEYYAGWALLGLGRPVMARERFVRFAESRVHGGGGRLDDFNRACYLALAGDAAGAIAAWDDAMSTPGGVGMRWAVVDPDLELIQPYLWENDLAFAVWRVVVAHERESRPWEALGEQRGRVSGAEPVRPDSTGTPSSGEPGEVRIFRTEM